MNFRSRMLDLLGESMLDTLDKSFHTKTAEEGDGALSRLSFSFNNAYGTGDLLFADAKDAEAASALLKPLGFESKAAQSAPYFTSLAAFKKSKFYTKLLQTKTLDDQRVTVRAQGKKWLQQWQGKKFTLPKAFLGLPAGTVFEATAYGALGTGFYLVRHWEDKMMSKKVADLDFISDVAGSAAALAALEDAKAH